MHGTTRKADKSNRLLSCSQIIQSKNGWCSIGVEIDVNRCLSGLYVISDIIKPIHIGHTEVYPNRVSCLCELHLHL